MPCPGLHQRTGDWLVSLNRERNLVSHLLNLRWIALTLPLDLEPVVVGAEGAILLQSVLGSCRHAVCALGLCHGCMCAVGSAYMGR